MVELTTCTVFCLRDARGRVRSKALKLSQQTCSTIIPGRIFFLFKDQQALHLEPLVHGASLFYISLPEGNLN